MGISWQVAEVIIREHAYRPISGRVLLLGRQTMFFSPEAALVLLERCGVTPADIDLASLEYDNQTLGSKGGTKGYIKDTDFFRLLGVNDVIALDHSPYEGAEIVWNLNNPCPEHLYECADFILDGSTLDNVFDPPCALRNIAKFLRPNGWIVSTNMGSNHFAPYMIPSPQWLFDYCVYNSFNDAKLYYFIYSPGGLNVFSLDVGTQRKDFPATETMHTPYMAGIIWVAEKGQESTWDVNPSQHHYRSDAEWGFFLERLGPFLNSKRPNLAFSRAPLDPTIPEAKGFIFVDPLSRIGCAKVP